MNESGFLRETVGRRLRLWCRACDVFWTSEPGRRAPVGCWVCGAVGIVAISAWKLGR